LILYEKDCITIVHSTVAQKLMRISYSDHQGRP